MRRAVFFSLVSLLALGAAYLAFPFYTAWSIKEAVKNGNSTYLARHIEWAPVKVTLKESMAEMVLNPIDVSVANKPQRKGLWQRFKAYYGKRVVHNLVDRYATPTGLPTLFSYGRTVSTNVLGRDDPDEGKPLPTRIANAWSRIERAEFITPTRFEIDMRDKFETTRIYAGVMELKGWTWKVTELRVQQRSEPDEMLQLTNATVFR
ncbi:MAG: DUF2939 domain-containing protein [Filomicrobium sp.]